MSKTMEQTSVETRIRQLAALAGFIASVLARLSFETVQYWLKHKTLLRQKLQEAFEIPIETYSGLRTEWEKFYKDHFDLVVDFSGVVIQERPSGGSWRLLFIPAGLTLNTTFAAMRKKFKVLVYTEDLDSVVVTNTRITVQSYVIWVRDGMEPDTEFLGKSTRMADMDGKIGMTLLERLVFEFKFFMETGQHLDPKGVTLCTGSRRSVGRVPYVYFNLDDSEVKVNCYSVGDSDSMVGLRQAVA